ncbi:MAG: hypothetical protein RSE91_01655, partial [Bacilli bacterium]
MKEKTNKFGKKKLKETTNNLKNTWAFAKKHKLKLVLYFVTTMALSAIGAIVPILSAKLLLNITNGLWKQLLIVAIIVFAIEMSRNI